MTTKIVTKIATTANNANTPSLNSSISLTAAGELAHEALLLDEGIKPVLKTGSLYLALALFQGVLEALDGAPDASDLTVRPARDAVLPARSLKLVQGDAQGASSCGMIMPRREVR